MHVATANDHLKGLVETLWDQAALGREADFCGQTPLHHEEVVRTRAPVSNKYLEYRSRLHIAGIKAFEHQLSFFQGVKKNSMRWKSYGAPIRIRT